MYECLWLFFIKPNKKRGRDRDRENVSQYDVAELSVTIGAKESKLIVIASLLHTSYSCALFASPLMLAGPDAPSLISFLIYSAPPAIFPPAARNGTTMLHLASSCLLTTTLCYRITQQSCINERKKEKERRNRRNGLEKVSNCRSSVVMVSRYLTLSPFLSSLFSYFSLLVRTGADRLLPFLSLPWKQS